VADSEPSPADATSTRVPIGGVVLPIWHPAQFRHREGTAVLARPQVSVPE
jgi:hypothetical protein